MVSSAGPMLVGGDGYVGLGRALWAAILAALDDGDATLRTEVYAQVVALGLPGWGDDLDDAGVLAGHVREVTGLPVFPDAVAVPDGWAQGRPCLSPGPVTQKPTGRESA